MKLKKIIAQILAAALSFSMITPIARAEKSEITNAVINGSDTVVTLNGISSGRLIAAKYDLGKLTDVKMQEVASKSVTINGFKADKIFVWDSESGEPLCAAKEVTAQVEPTDDPNLPEQFTITVEQTAGGTVTVYNNSKFNSVTADIPSGVTAGTVISDNAFYTLAAPSVLIADTDKAGIFDNKSISTGYAELRISGSDTADKHKFAVYTAKADGKLTVYARSGANKKIGVESGSGVKSEKFLNDGDGSGAGNVYGTASYDVTKGETYKIYCAGGTGRLFGIKYESTDYPHSTDTMTVDKNDELRVVAKPDSGYSNGNILIDGNEVSTSKEYTFKVTNSAAVSATFTSEPELIETTEIASDIPLTREAMGAVMYDAFNAKYGKDENGNWNKVYYMKQTGSVPSPDDPSYDPNIQYEGETYLPLTGFGSLTDTDEADKTLYGKVKEAYNLGLIRTENGIKRGEIKNGTLLEPKEVVTRAKAAKSLLFAYLLTQDPKGENQTTPTSKKSVPIEKADLQADGEPVVVDFTSMTEASEYTAEKGQGFVSQSDCIMPDGYKRQVAPVSGITVDVNGASVTESDGAYLKSEKDNNNYGGLIYRIDTGKAGAYRLEVEINGSASDMTVAPTGMEASRLTGTGAWDTAGLVKKNTAAQWNGNKWTYDFATGENFIEIEIEPKSLPTAAKPCTVGLKSVKITPLAKNDEGNKPTIFILGDSTQKTYTFDEIISGWGQTLINYFDTDKVNVVNYSMGGRAMKNNYTEGRTNDVLVNGKKGDYVFIHSAHNDEQTGSEKRFVRGTNYGTPEQNNALYNEWLDMYAEMIKARGMIPVFVTAMPRVNGSTGKYSENTNKPNGFNPDSPALMRQKAASDSGIGLIELYAGAKQYLDSIDPMEVCAIYNNTEAGETPASNCANGAKGDGTHFKEAASKQWNRIMLKSIYDQSVSETDTYADKAIMSALASYMTSDVQSAASSGDWSAVFPEMAADVSAVGIIPNAHKQTADNFYYRNNIEKVLQLGLMSKDENNMFRPTEAITVGEFARAMEKAFALPENSLSGYTKTKAELEK